MRYIKFMFLLVCILSLYTNFNFFPKSKTYAQGQNDLRLVFVVGNSSWINNTGDERFNAVQSIIYYLTNLYRNFIVPIYYAEPNNYNCNSISFNIQIAVIYIDEDGASAVPLEYIHDNTNQIISLREYYCDNKVDEIDNDLDAWMRALEPSHCRQVGSCSREGNKGADYLAGWEKGNQLLQDGTPGYSGITGFVFIGDGVVNRNIDYFDSLSTSISNPSFVAPVRPYFFTYDISEFPGAEAGWKDLSEATRGYTWDIAQSENAIYPTLLGILIDLIKSSPVPLLPESVEMKTINPGGLNNVDDQYVLDHFQQQMLIAPILPLTQARQTGITLIEPTIANYPTISWDSDTKDNDIQPATTIFLNQMGFSASGGFQIWDFLNPSGGDWTIKSLIHNTHNLLANDSVLIWHRPAQIIIQIDNKEIYQGEEFTVSAQIDPANPKYFSSTSPYRLLVSHYCSTNDTSECELQPLALVNEVESKFQGKVIGLAGGTYKFEPKIQLNENIQNSNAIISSDTGTVVPVNVGANNTIQCPNSNIFPGGTFSITMTLQPSRIIADHPFTYLTFPLKWIVDFRKNDDQPIGVVINQQDNMTQGTISYEIEYTDIGDAVKYFIEVSGIHELSNNVLFTPNNACAIQVERIKMLEPNFQSNNTQGFNITLPIDNVTSWLGKSVSLQWQLLEDNGQNKYIETTRVNLDSEGFIISLPPDLFLEENKRYNLRYNIYMDIIATPIYPYPFDEFAALCFYRIGNTLEKCQQS